MLCPSIDNSASYKIHAVIHFLHAKSMSAAEIHRELCAAVYVQSLLVKELEDNGVECSKMSGRVLVMKSEAVSHF
jgi:hypothetical protein